VRGGDGRKVQQVDAVAVACFEIPMHAVGALHGADDVDAGWDDPCPMSVDSILRYDTGNATVLLGCVVGT
jgi:hypothetical protein